MLPTGLYLVATSFYSHAYFNLCVNLRFSGVQYNKPIQKSQLWSKPYFKRVEYDGMGEFL